MTQLSAELLPAVLMEARAAMQDFIDKVDRGEARSIRSYKRFKEVVDRIDTALSASVAVGRIEPWIGVDLDGTLAEYHGWKGPENIGAPIQPILERVKRILAEGEVIDNRLVRKVKIFTSRASIPSQVPPVQKWLREQGLNGVEITCIKDIGCVLVLDDRCEYIVSNTGMTLMDFLTHQAQANPPAAGQSK